MMNDFFERNAALAAKRQRLVRAINELMGVCRANGVPIIWVRTEFAADLLDMRAISNQPMLVDDNAEVKKTDKPACWMRGHMVRRCIDAFGVGIALCAVACGDRPTPAAPTPPPAPTVRIDDIDSLTLQPGLKVQLRATLATSGGVSSDCTTTAVWSSSNEGLLKLTSVRPGEVVITGSGDGQVTAVCDTITGRLTIHVDQPTSWPISGRVLAAPEGASIPGASLALEGYAPAAADDSGRFKLITPDASIRRLIVSAPGYLPYETFLRGGELRDVDVPLIGEEPAFPLRLYREMTRNAWASPATMTTTAVVPWMQDPNIFIWTRWRDTGAPVNNVDWYIAQIRRAIPLLTGGRRQAGIVETGSTLKPFTPGWIVLWFDHGGNYAWVGGVPYGNVQLGGDHTCNSQAVMHEFGHAMGYWHISQIPSVMGGGPIRNCDDISLTPLEQIVAKTMYTRPRGNMDPDRDPAGTALLGAAAEAPVRVECDTILAVHDRDSRLAEKIR